MIDAGFPAPLFHIRETAVMGFTEVAGRYLKLRRIFKQTVEALRSTRPDLLVLVDYPGFNLRLAAEAKKLGIPTLYYIAPKVWAWGKGRLSKMRNTIDQLAVIFPFEESFFSKADIRTTYVGNPVSEITHSLPARESFLNHLGLSNSDRLLGLLPGSRTQEVDRMLPVMISAARRLLAEKRFDALLLSKAPSLTLSALRPYLPSDLPVHIIEHGPAPVMAFSDFLFVKSGTATLETALFEKPFIVLYRTSPISAFIGRRLVKLPQFSMANIVCGEEVVPELFQEEVTEENLFQTSKTLLDSPERLSAIRRKFQEMKALFTGHVPSRHVADLIGEMTHG